MRVKQIYGTHEGVSVWTAHIPGQEEGRRWRAIYQLLKQYDFQAQARETGGEGGGATSY